ncbi:Gfo/Idh/MocA family oxidoreductase [Candidatus Poribacteria bacterium]|nr:Gfo/Idh/MocA family oxidoreductase [Candidatus Poribacteria bacterium]
MGSPVKIAVVGCGWAGRQAVLAGVAVLSVEVVAIAEMDASRRESVAGEFGIPRAYADLSGVLGDPEVEAVYLATSPDGRLPLVLDTLAAGKHVLVQKPHAIRAPEVLEMDTASQRAGKVLQFCYFLRHFPHNRRIRSAVARGAIGEPYHARVFLKFNAIPPMNDVNRWLHVYGHKGGALGQHASHELDMVWWWMGCPEPEWAFAAKHSLYPVYDGPEGPSEDYFSGIAGFAGGKTVQIDCSRMLHTDSPTAVELYGTTGAIRGGALHRFRDGEFVSEAVDDAPDVPHTEPPESRPAFYYEVEHFAMAVRGEVAPDVCAADSYRFMKLLDALYDSAREGRQIVVAAGWRLQSG